MKKLLLASTTIIVIFANLVFANVGPGVDQAQSGQIVTGDNVINSENVDYDEKQILTTKTGVVISVPRYIKCPQGHLTINEVVLHDWSDDLTIEPLASVSFMVRGLRVESKFDIIAKDALGNIVDKVVKTIGVEMDMNKKGKLVAKACYDPFSYTLERNKGIATVEVVSHTEE